MLFYCFLFILGINFLGLLWCYFNQSDHLTDLVYNLSFFSVIWAVTIWQGNYHPTSLLLAGMISLWAIRLGSYLLIRIRKMGRDQRFDQMRSQFMRIAGFWSLQTISIWIIILPSLIFIHKAVTEWNVFMWIGAAIWTVGFVVETVSDWQKYQFKINSKNNGKPIMTGLWKYSQYPNYLGEILCWVGIFIYTSTVLEAWEWLSVVSPLWISLLLIKISGIPLLEKRAYEKYKHLETYQHYIQQTPRLLFW